MTLVAVMLSTVASYVPSVIRAISRRVASSADLFSLVRGADLLLIMWTHRAALSSHTSCSRLSRDSSAHSAYLGNRGSASLLYLPAVFFSASLSRIARTSHFFPPRHFQFSVLTPVCFSKISSAVSSWMTFSSFGSSGTDLLLLSNPPAFLLLR